MDQHAAIQEIRSKALEIATCVTSTHPLVPALGHAETQAQVFNALFELTKQVEVVKKHLLKLEKRDESGLL